MNRDDGGEGEIETETEGVAEYGGGPCLYAYGINKESSTHPPISEFSRTFYTPAYSPPPLLLLPSFDHDSQASGSKDGQHGSER